MYGPAGDLLSTDAFAPAKVPMPRNTSRYGYIPIYKELFGCHHKLVEATGILLTKSDKNSVVYTNILVFGCEALYE